MTEPLRPSNPCARELFDVISEWPIYDAHSHIDPASPAARTFDEILGYHYYTELAHSAGMPAELANPERDPRQRAIDLAGYLEPIRNTIQYSWLLEIAREFHGVEGHIDPTTIEALYDTADHRADGPTWDARVWEHSKLEAVFLTNDFDDPLEGFDTSKFVPCLRTDDLVLKLDRPETRHRLQKATDSMVDSPQSLRAAIGTLFERFGAKGVRACAISLPPDFVPAPPDAASESTLARALGNAPLNPVETQTVRRWVFWTLNEFCADFGLPFDLMIGPIRDIYPAGVAGGRDLFDRRVSLADYRDVFNHFPRVQYPVSTLSPDAGPELVAYSWIFPNVLPHGHWWYSNIPPYIAADLQARLTAVPQTKVLGYYSDAYKLEFVRPKFQMYRRALSDVLARDFVATGRLDVEGALALARTVLLENPRRVFRAQDGS